MTGALVALAAAFVLLLWAAITVRRRAIRTYLLATGIRTKGVARLVRVRGRRAPVVSVDYVDNNGVERTVRKSLVSAGDAELAAKPVTVLFHPRRTTRDDYVLLGFGEAPATWFRVSFGRSTGNG